MSDTLGHRKVLGVMTPAMNTVVQPELEMLRPDGVTNQMQRFRLAPGVVSEDLIDEAQKLMDCKPVALAIGLTTDAAPGGVDALAGKCAELAEAVKIPVFNASQADHEALRTLGAKRVSVVTPFKADLDANVKANVEAAGFDVAAIKGTECASLEAICATSLDDIRRVFREVNQPDIDAILQVGTALPVVAIIAELEAELGKPIVACNAAVYWQTLRGVGITDSLTGFGSLLAEH